MPDDNTPTAIGGAIATSKKPAFTDFAGLAQLVSSSGGDTTQSVTISYRTSTGTISTEAKTLSGTTPVLYVATIERLLKGIKSATSGGSVAVEAQVAERQATAQAGSLVNTLRLDAGASAVNGFYNGMIVRLISGTGAFQINEVIDYNGATKDCTLRDYWHGSIPDGSTVFRLAKGFFFDRQPFEITEVRRIHYDASSNPLGGGAVNYYDKLFFVNSSNSGALLTATVVESLDPSGKMAFGLEAVVNGTGTNGAGNSRIVAPSGITFASSSVVVPGSNLNAGSSIGVWMRLSLLEADAPQKTTVTMQLTGTTA